MYRPHKSSQFNHEEQIATNFPPVRTGTIPTLKRETEVLQGTFQAHKFVPETTFNWCWDRGHGQTRVPTIAFHGSGHGLPSLHKTRTWATSWSLQCLASFPSPAQASGVPQKIHII